MRLLPVVAAIAVLAGCSKPAPQPAVDTTTAVVTPPPPPALSLASMAGTWSMQTMDATSDSVLLAFTFVATADTTGWAFKFANRPPVPVRVVALAGDSVITDAGPYASMLRKGVQVTTHSVMRLQNGALVGTTMAHYKVAGTDTVRALRTKGTRAP